MVEHRSQPSGWGVACRARCREVRRLVVRIVRAQVISSMTRVAVGRSALIHAVEVALRTGHGRVRAG